MGRQILGPLEAGLPGFRAGLLDFKTGLPSFRAGLRGLETGLRGLRAGLRCFGAGLLGLRAGLRGLRARLRNSVAISQGLGLKPRSPVTRIAKTPQNTRKIPKGVPERVEAPLKHVQKRICVRFARVLRGF